MTKKFPITLIFCLAIVINYVQAQENNDIDKVDLPIDSVTPLQKVPAIADKMRADLVTCPVQVDELSLLKVRYFGFDHKTHAGDMIVHHQVALDTLTIFKVLYRNHYPIEKMHLMSDYKNDDVASMEDNNTSAFNCRPITGKPGVYSKHSYGIAIGINPKINPYVKGTIVLPENGKPYVDRTKDFPGKIDQKTIIYQTFSLHGWQWGGNWISLKDYQHFEKDLQ